MPVNAGTLLPVERAPQIHAARLPVMEWSDALSIGIPEIDAQHRVFVGMLDRLRAVSGEPGANRNELRVLLSDLVTYAEHHFVDEEERMVAAGYPGAAAHDSAARRIHDLLIRDADEVELYRFLSAFLKAWLVNHIMREDKAFGDWLTGATPAERCA